MVQMVQLSQLGGCHSGCGPNGTIHGLCTRSCCRPLPKGNTQVTSCIIYTVVTQWKHCTAVAELPLLLFYCMSPVCTTSQCLTSFWALQQQFVFIIILFQQGAAAL